LLQVKEQAPWFGLEQEYTLFLRDKVTPLGWPKGGYPGPQGPYYCSIGTDNAFGRDVAEAHLKACLYAGLQISGVNGEVMPGQWEYQIGPVEGIAIGDHMWISRYIMHRVCERFGVICSLHPKPLMGDWNGAGCHHNFSTKDMRDPSLHFEYTPASGPYAGKLLKGGFAKIIEATDKLGAPGKPAEHIAVYGKHNRLRLTGRHETASIDQYSYGVANRGASIRIPRETEAKGYGYLEDRRPASNIDPYVTCAKMTETIIL
jgi:glutamine synthetase